MKIFWISILLGGITLSWSQKAKETEHELYFYAFELEFSDSRHTHLAETLPSILALKLGGARLPSYCHFSGRKKEVRSFQGYFVKGKIIKNMNVFEMKIGIQHYKTGKYLESIYLKGSVEQLWESTNQMAFMIAQRIEFYLDPVDKAAIEDLHLPVETFKIYQNAVQEEEALRFESAGNFYKRVLEKSPNFKLAQSSRVRCLYRCHSLDFDVFAKELLEKNDNDPDVLYLKVRQAYQEEETYRAKHWLESALLKNKKHRETRLTQVCIQVLENDYFGAQTNIKDLSIREENNPLVYWMQLFERPKGQIKEEEQDELLEKGFAFLEDEDPWILHVGAKALLYQGNKIRARELLIRAEKQAKSCGYDLILQDDLKKLK